MKSSEAPHNEEIAAMAEEGVQKEDSKTAVEDSKEPLVAEVEGEEREERIPSGFVIVERYSWRGEQQHSDTETEQQRISGQRISATTWVSEIMISVECHIHALMCSVSDHPPSCE